VAVASGGGAAVDLPATVAFSAWSGEKNEAKTSNAIEEWRGPLLKIDIMSPRRMRICRTRKSRAFAFDKLTGLFQGMADPRGINIPHAGQSGADQSDRRVNTRSADLGPGFEQGNPGPCACRQNGG
jgi:hypothetical protein